MSINYFSRLVGLVVFLILASFEADARAIVDPIRFTVETSATSLSLNEETEIIVRATLLSFPTNTAFVFKDSYTFKIKLVMPEGFVRTCGTYHD